MEQVLCCALMAKIEEQIERSDHLVGLLPGDRIEWQPPIPGAWTPGVLLGHLLECLAGFCAVLYAAEPERLCYFDDLRHLSVNHLCGKHEARERMAAYRDHIRQGFELLTDSALAERLPTIFAAEGETLLTLLLGNLEHLINHKHQLFTYLKLLDVEVSSCDLYHFRGTH
jgi:DinB superfamily